MENLRHGYGVHSFANGYYYKGQWANDKRNGYGEAWEVDAVNAYWGLGKYVGEWMNN